MDTSIIMDGATIVKTIAAYLGLIDSVSSDLKKLIHQSFRSAIELLNFASNVSGKQQKEYLRQALLKFVEATVVEENENLVSSYLGLAMCLHLLGDDMNAKLSMEKLEKVELTFKEQFRSSIAASVAQSYMLRHERERRLKAFKIKSLEIMAEQKITSFQVY